MLNWELDDSLVAKGSGPIVRCDSSTFIKITTRVYATHPDNLWQWLFGKKTTVYRCAKCKEVFLRQPTGKCEAQLS